MNPSLTRRHWLAAGLASVPTALATALTTAGRARATESALFPLAPGVSVHHMLNWPDVTQGPSGLAYRWPPFQRAAFGMSDAEIARLKAAGFRVVRLTADPSIWLASPPERRTELAAITTGTIRRFLGAGLDVVYDLHPVNVNPAWGPERLVTAIDGPAFRAYADLVERVATELRGLPRDRVVFELINEPPLDRPADIRRWQPMMELLHRRARAAAPDLPLVVTGAQWGSHRALIQLDPTPFRGSNVVYTFHFYEPAAFTHQGVEKVDWQYIKDLSWPPRRTLQEAVAAATARVRADPGLDEAGRTKQTAYTTKLLGDYFAGTNDVAQIRAEFQKVADWAKRHGIPTNRIYLGEFGVVHNPGDPDNGWLDWLRAVRETADSFGFGWSLWAYKGWGGMSLTGDHVRTVPQPEMLAALGLKAA